MTGAEMVVGINGYGRIGRAFHRLSLLDPAIRVAAVNSRSDADTLGHLLAYDSVYGELDADVVAREAEFSVAGQSVQVYQEAAPESIPWDRHNIDVVIDATGKFKDRDSLAAHLKGSVQYVILCCPPKDDRIPSVVMGVNHGLVNPASESIISNASCTTNALTPLIHILDEAFGLEFCSFRTIHALTDSQHLLDNSDKDLRRARAAMESIIPTSTGASSMIEQFFPHLKGKVHGMAYRVPTRSVSTIDLCVRLRAHPRVETINREFIKAGHGMLEGIVNVTNKPLVSIDFKGDSHSVIVDLPFTKACGDGMYNLTGWYDNEWGYSARLLDMVRHVARTAVTNEDHLQSEEVWPCAMSATA